jgi:hypothetical protein
MSSAPHVVPIFATPLGVVSLPAVQETNAALTTLFTARAQPAWREPGTRTPSTTFRSRDDLIQWPEAPVQLLLRELLAGVSSVVAAISDLTPEQFAALRLEARSWFTIIETNGYVAPETHPNTSWTAVYCVAAPPASPTRQDSGVLRLHNSGQPPCL